MSKATDKSVGTRFRRPAEALREISDVIAKRSIEQVPPPQGSIRSDQLCVCCLASERIDDLTLLAIAEKHEVAIEINTKGFHSFINVSPSCEARLICNE